MWDPSLLFFEPTVVSEQAIHGKATLPGNVTVCVSFVYALCDRKARQPLWSELTHCAGLFKEHPWVIMGDFNVTRWGTEHSSSRIVTKAMNDFSHAIETAELEDLKSTGWFHTWSNLRSGTEAVSKKLDRALGNWHWFNSMGDTYAHFHPPGISGHSPVTIHMRTKQQFRGRPFKFLNFWAHSEQFLDVVGQEWAKVHTGSPLVVIHKKLKCLKARLKEFCMRPDSRVVELRGRLHQLQQDLHEGLGTSNSLQQERLLRQEVVKAASDEEAFFKQKSRVLWLKEGDSNTAFFHRVVKVRQSRNHLVRIKDDNDSWVLAEAEIAQIGVNHFSNILGTSGRVDGWECNLFGYDKQIAAEYQNSLGCPITAQEVKAALWSLNPLKAPGPDGYNGFFFKEAWCVIGDECINAICNFFTSGSLPA
ncbi:Exo_endo_phos domain-containing protein [Cephalotus follicularis]|uniref:Exo_endo_phos domain-containing protein n=1 Tax=Cephalotus follicularis TaxID=3775 RepID=A0A1Q3DJ25_CEPFO|nr:Exo_endo_phos domain-containing protein [Cephalotus follicularis]